ncbi:MAG: hypothetical protein ACR65R_11785 [Methylomicrobium sp.]
MAIRLLVDALKAIHSKSAPKGRFPKQSVGSMSKRKTLSEIDAAVEEAEAVYSCRVPCLTSGGARQSASTA